MTKRLCPMCLEGEIIRYNHRTCSTECGRAWVKLSRAEQQARLKEAEEKPSTLLAELNKTFGKEELAVKGRPKDFVEDLPLPSAIFGEKEEK